MKCPRKRTLLMVLLLLTGGAIINVAVAWGCALWRPFDKLSTDPEQFPTLITWWNRHYPFEQIAQPHLIDHRNDKLRQSPRSHASDRAITEDHAGVATCSGLVLTMISGTDTGSRSAGTAYVAIFEAGWPFLAFCCDRWRRDGDPSQRAQRLERQNYAIRPDQLGIHPSQDEISFLTGGGRLFPYCPLWPGFAINTIFYAAILWLPFAVFRFARRRIRARRGQCPACAYPVGKSDVCTECGKPVTNESVGQKP